MIGATRHRSSMLLFAAPASCWSHRVRLVLAEKGIRANLIEADPHQPPEDLLDLNPYGSVPTLVDRDLVLYDSRVIIEYLDERFPHPSLLPADPVNRARFRLALARVEHDWYSLLPQLEGPVTDQADGAQARKTLTEGLAASNEVFAAKPFFLSDEVSLVDCSLAPLLWRLPHFGVELPPQAGAVLSYIERMFNRSAFVQSLSRQERDMRPKRS